VPRGPLLALVAFAAACGGRDEASPTAAETTAQPSPTTIVTVTPEQTARPAPTPTGRPRFTVTLTAESPTGTVGKPWRYTVRATRPGGGPAGATAKMRVFVGSELVDTLGFFAFDGTLTRTHRWPPVLRGKNVVFQAEVEGEGGTHRKNLNVTIR
jgi:hypothetical protein